MLDERTAYNNALARLRRLETRWRLGVATGKPVLRATVLRDRATATLAAQGLTFRRAAIAHNNCIRGLPHDRVAAHAYVRAFLAAYDQGTART
jgi:hypothetical protein